LLEWQEQALVGCPELGGVHDRMVQRQAAGCHETQRLIHLMRELQVPHPQQTNKTNRKTIRKNKKKKKKKKKKNHQTSKSSYNVLLFYDFLFGVCLLHRFYIHAMQRGDV
jgi:hypothetical protein